MHTWQAGLRGIGAEWPSGAYHRHVHGNMAMFYTPQDTYLGNLIGALNQLDNGVTTLFDWCHVLRDLEMAERAVDALEESGIRAVFGHGTAKPPAAPGDRPFPEVPHPRERLEALRKGRFSSDDGLVTLGMAALGPDYSTWEVTRHDYALARELDLYCSIHSSAGAGRRITPDGFLRLAEEGLLGEKCNIVHGNHLADDELKVLVDNGATITATVLVELHGNPLEPLIHRVIQLGGLPSIGIDTEVIVSGEMFREMQSALIFARHAGHQAREAGQKTTEVSTRDGLKWATIAGAAAFGLDGRIGSLTPGKKADVVLVRANDLNLVPIHSPLYSVVEQAHGGNVDTVFIDGVLRKRDGKLLFPEQLLRQRQAEMAASAQRIMDKAQFVAKAM
ncbi:amidohydrolase family protein, partial [Rhizobiaceae sp. 2RAB30]